MLKMNRSHFGIQTLLLFCLVVNCLCQSTTQLRSKSTYSTVEKNLLENDQLLREKLYNTEEKLAMVIDKLESSEKTIEIQASEMDLMKTQLANISQAMVIERLDNDEKRLAQASELASIKAELNQEKEMRVKSEFLARRLSLDQALPTYQRDERMIYRDVVTNPGQHYNTTTGEYTCPVNGTYFFTYSIYSRIEDVNPQVTASLYREGTWISTIFFVNYNSERVFLTPSRSDIVQCSEGDRVWVQSDYDNNLIYGNHIRNAFSGLLLNTT